MVAKSLVLALLASPAAALAPAPKKSTLKVQVKAATKQALCRSLSTRIFTTGVREGKKPVFFRHMQPLLAILPLDRK